MIPSAARYFKWQQQLNSSRFFRGAAEAAGIYSVFILAAISVDILVASRKVFLLAFFALILARFMFVPLINSVYKKPRPYQKFGFAPNTAKLMSSLHDRPDAFPSQHVISMAAVSAAFWQVSPVLSAVGLGLSLLAGIARIILGYHDWYDVLGGLVLGAISAAAVTAVLLSFTR